MFEHPVNQFPSSQMEEWQCFSSDVHLLHHTLLKPLTGPLHWRFAHVYLQVHVCEGMLKGTHLWSERDSAWSLHTPGQLRERSLSYLWKSTRGCDAWWLLMFAHVWLPSIPRCLCSLLVHCCPLSFLLSHPCQLSHINKPVRPNGWPVWGGFARGAPPFTVFFLYTKYFLY